MILTGYFGGYSQYSDTFEAKESESAVGMARAAEETGVPFLAHTMYWKSGPAETLRANGVPVYREVEAAVGVASRLARKTPEALLGIPELPEPSTAIEGEMGYFEARAILATGGVPFAEARKVADVQEALVAGEAVGYPVVLKALGELHKSDSGGVAVGLRDAQELTEALEQMEAALHPDWFSVEAMAPLARGLELIVGAKRDPRFGPILLVGAGGLYAEIVKDVAVALAPVTEAGAEALFRSLRVAPLLDGARGKPAVDVGAASAAAAALSRVAAAHQEIAEIEINPLLALPDGALGTRRAYRPRLRCSPRAHSTARWRSSPAAAAAWGGRSRSSWAGSGASVAVAGRRPEPLEETVALLGPATGSRCRPTCATRRPWTRSSRRRSRSSAASTSSSTTPPATSSSRRRTSPRTAGARSSPSSSTAASSARARRGSR